MAWVAQLLGVLILTEKYWGRTARGIECAKAHYKQRHKIENMLAKLKDWRHIGTRYDRCAHTFLTTIRIAATAAVYLKECIPTVVSCF